MYVGVEGKAGGFNLSYIHKSGGCEMYTDELNTRPCLSGRRKRAMEEKRKEEEDFHFSVRFGSDHWMIWRITNRQKMCSSCESQRGVIGVAGIWGVWC